MTPLQPKLMFPNHIFEELGLSEVPVLVAGNFFVRRESILHPDKVQALCRPELGIIFTADLYVRLANSEDEGLRWPDAIVYEDFAAEALAVLNPVGGFKVYWDLTSHQLPWIRDHGRRVRHPALAFDLFPFLIGLDFVIS